MRLITILLLFIGLSANGQDSTLVKGQTRKTDSIITAGNQTKAETKQVLDTFIDGRTVFKKAEGLEPIIERNLTDDEFAASIDQKWLDELYSLSLYDTIYKSVSELNYEPVYYPELSTDTLKARLERLNSKTPFNVEYNPSLESVIKSYLKNRKESLHRLMVLSDYYFPLFEQELDNHDIPLEIKYLAIVESALKPKAKSRVVATGLWQFIFTR